MKDGGLVNVRNDGTGDAGNLEIRANNIKLDNAGSITADTNSGEGGNIFVRSQNLQLNNSFITASAGGSGNGGNIDIDTDLLTVLERSKITADAFKGIGGNIQINTSSLFRSPDSQLSASSQLGINGSVQINTLDVNPSNVTAQPEAIPVTPKISSVCQRQSSAVINQFIITGTGGIPSSPNDALSSPAGWYDNSFPAGTTENSRKLERSAPDEPTQLVEAQGWRQNLDGSITLTAQTNSVVPYSSLTTPTCDRPPTPGITSLKQEGRDD